MKGIVVIAGIGPSAMCSSTLDLKYSGNDNHKQMGVRGRLSEQVSSDWKISALYIVIRPLLGPGETAAQLVRLS